MQLTQDFRILTSPELFQIVKKINNYEQNKNKKNGIEQLGMI